MKRLIGCAILGLLVFGCGPSQPSAPSQQATQAREFKLDGEIISVDKDKKTAVIKHGNIEGFMAAMTMSYPVPEPRDIEKIKAGDHITATLYDEPKENRMWVGNIQVEAKPN